MMKLVPYIIAVTTALSILGYVYWKGGADKEDEIILKDLEVTVQQQEDLNEIRNNRPNDAALIDSLRSGEF